MSRVGRDGADEEVSPAVDGREGEVTLTGIAGRVVCAESPSAYARSSCAECARVCLTIPGPQMPLNPRTLGGLPRGFFAAAG